jgi:hypothetical protein
VPEAGETAVFGRGLRTGRLQCSASIFRNGLRAGRLQRRQRSASNTNSCFAWLRPSLYDGRVLELEVFAAGVRDLNKILELDIELGAIAGLHYKVDRNHDIVYMELEGPTVTFREIRSIFRKLGLDPKFVGAIPAELRPKTKTQLLEA